MRNDTALVDRIHCSLPGWDVPKISEPIKTNHFGLVSDFLSECWSRLRGQSRMSVLQGRLTFGGKRIGTAEFRNTQFSYTLGSEGIEKFVVTPELQSEDHVGPDQKLAQVQEMAQLSPREAGDLAKQIVQNRTRRESADGQALSRHADLGYTVHLFVRSDPAGEKSYGESEGTHQIRVHPQRIEQRRQPQP